VCEETYLDTSHVATASSLGQLSSSLLVHNENCYACPSSGP